MRERWDEAINKIDEKYIAEAAETHAKHAEKQLEAERFEAEGERPTAISAAPAKKSSRGRVIGICSAAAAVALIAVGGGVMLSRDGSILTGDTTTESTFEATTESGESIDYAEGTEHIIDFSHNYEEGYIGFVAPEKSAWLGGNGVRGPISDWERADVFDYVHEISDIDIEMMDKNLIDNGYILNLSDNKSYMNSLASAEAGNRQITLSYTKGGAEILINLGESEDNFRYHFYGDEACRLDAQYSGDSYLRSFWTGGNAAISIGGMINADECRYYAVDISGLEEDIYCSISAMGCTTEDILDTLAGLVCDTDALTESSAEPLDLSQYSAFELSRWNVDMPLSEYMMEELITAAFELEEPQPIYSIGSCETLSAKLKMYRSETADGHYEYLQLHKKTGGSVDEYYYSISDNNNTAYFRISEESYERLYDWFAFNGPAYFDGRIIAEDDIGNITSPEDGRYLVEREHGLVMLHDDGMFAVGDTVRVWFDGYIMESYPEQVNEIKVEKIYAAAEDESPLVPEGEEIGGFDADIYEEYFLGQWGVMDGMEYTYTFDYNSGFVDHIACGELSDGYYFCCYNAGQPEFCFIPKECTDYMFAYGAVDLQAPKNSKRSDFYDEFYRRADIGNSLSGELNMMGAATLIDRMGGNFGEVYSSLYADITDDEGRVWRFDQGKAGINDTKPHLKDYSQGGMAAYAEIFMEYADIATYDYMTSDYDADTRWYSHFIAMVDGEYKIVSTLPCDRNGNVAPNAEGKNFAEADLYGHGVTAVFSWAGTNEYTAYPQVYVEDTNTRKVLAQTTIQNPAMFSYGGPLFEDMEIFVKDIQLEGGAVFAVLIPRSQNGPYRGYEVSFYWYDKLNKEIRLVGEADGGFFPMCMNERIETEPENNTVKIYWTDASLRAFRFEFDTNSVSVYESELSDGTFTVDYSKGGTGKEFAVFGKAFAGKWKNGSGTWDFDLYSDYFSYADPCSFYEEDYGYFMLAEGRVWFISKDDMDHLYYFEDVQDGDELSLSAYKGAYGRTEPLQGWYGGEGEMGWFGLLDFLYTEDDRGVSVDKLFDIEITDENGNVWVRTPDKDIDWGGIYEGNVNGDTVYFLKMQSKNHPDVFQYFSFNFNIVKLRTGELSYSDEHYSFNMDIFDTEKLATDYAAAAKADAESMGHGYFVVDTEFFTMENGTYYAVRMMGNNQAQWLSNGEVFYNTRDFDGVQGYEKVCDTGICDCAANGNYLYRLYNKYDEDGNTTLWLMAHDGSEGTGIMVDADGFVPMDAYIEIYGNETKWLIAGFHDAEIGGNRYVAFDITDPSSGLASIYATDLVHNENGTITINAEDGRTLILGGATVTEING